MAKAGFWLQGAKGKLAGTILQKGEGGTIQRIATDPKNPRTNRQMMNRIIFATVAQAAKYLRPIINNSYEGITDPALAIRHFRKINCDRIRALTATEYGQGDYPLAFFTTKRISTAIPNQYIISQGSVSLPQEVKATEDGTCMLQIDVTIPVTIDEQSHQVSCKKADALKIFGIYGTNEQLTVVGIRTGETIYQMKNYVSGAGMCIQDGKVQAGRLVPKADIVLTDTMVIGTLNNVFQPNKANIEGLFNTEKTDEGLLGMIVNTIEEGVEFTESSMTINIMSDNIFNDGHMFNALGVIKSVNDNGEWKYSTSVMLTAEYRTEDFGLTRENAITAWFEGSEVADDGKFLSQGGDVNAIN